MDKGHRKGTRKISRKAYRKSRKQHGGGVVCGTKTCEDNEICGMDSIRQPKCIRINNGRYAGKTTVRNMTPGAPTKVPKNY
jgi:hypothetical protein